MTNITKLIPKLELMRVPKLELIGVPKKELYLLLSITIRSISILSNKDNTSHYFHNARVGCFFFKLMKQLLRMYENIHYSVVVYSIKSRSLYLQLSRISSKFGTSCGLIGSDE